MTVTAFASRVRDEEYQDNIWTTSVDEARRRTGQMLTQSEVSSFWFSEAWRQMRARPGHATTLFMKKVWLFWHGQEIYNTSSVYDGREYSPYLWAMLWRNNINFPSGVLFPLSIAGLLWAVRRKVQISVLVSFLITITVVVAAFFVCARFRQPIIPVASIFAVYLVAEWWLLLCRRAVKQLVILTGTTTFFVVALNIGGDVDSVSNHSQAKVIAGCTFFDRSHYSDAIPYFERAIAINPNNLQAYDLLGNTLLKLRKSAQAEEVYKKGLAIAPTSAVFNLQLGVISLSTNRCALALDHFRATLRSAPDYLPAMDRVGISFMCLGILDSALYYRKRIASMLPPDSARQAEIDSLQVRLLRESSSGLTK